MRRSTVEVQLATVPAAERIAALIIATALLLIPLTPAGAQTRLVLDVSPGSVSSYPDGFAVAAGTLFFVANDGVHGRELWRSDGTTAGTRMVVDLNTGPGDGFPYDDHLVALAGKIFFGATNGQRGAQLWRSDGTPDGTVLVTDAAPGELSQVRNLVVSGSALYFMATTGFGAQEGGPDGYDRLWRSDGSSEGTIAVTDLGLFVPGGFGEYKVVDQLQPLNDLLLATVRDGTECCETVSLVRVDARGDAHLLLSEHRPGHLRGLIPPGNLTVVGNALFFTMDDNCQLWRTDGTTTFQVAIPGRACDIDNLTASGGDTLFFTHYDGSQATGLWNVSASGLDPTLIMAPPGNRHLGPLVQVGSRLFFLVWSGNVRALWSSDGTAAGTALLRTFTGTVSPDPLVPTNVGGTLLFVADDVSSGPAVWKSDGTADGTVPVGSLPNDPMYIFSPDVAAAGSNVFFVAQDPVHGAELWAVPLHALEGSCAGDCDMSRHVTVDEIVMSVRIAAGEMPLSACVLADFNGDGDVTIDELIVAVNSALMGCVGSSPMPAPTPTPPFGSCRETNADCRGSGLEANCLEPGGFAGCGPTPAPVPTYNQCTSDSDCTSRGDNFICAPVDRRTCQFGLACLPGCASDGDCPGDQSCGTSHRCTPRACASDNDCPRLFACTALPDSNEQGCLRRTCATDRECGGGLCVNRSCYSMLGTCATPPA